MKYRLLNTCLEYAAGLVLAGLLALMLYGLATLLVSGGSSCP